MHFLSFFCKIKHRHKNKNVCGNVAKQRVGGGGHKGSESLGQSGSSSSSSRKEADSCCCCCCCCCPAGEPGVHCLTALTPRPDWCHLSVPLDALCCVLCGFKRDPPTARQSSPGYRKNVKMSFIIGHKPPRLVCEAATGRSSALFASTRQREDLFSGSSHITTNVFKFGEKNNNIRLFFIVRLVLVFVIPDS